MTQREKWIEWISERSSPEPNTGCWLWLRAFKGSYPGHGDGVYVNRTTLGLKAGDPRQACHTCDQKACVNPGHLYAGSRYDNARDRVVRLGHHNSKKTACPKGHAYDSKVWNGKMWARSCSICVRTRSLRKNRK